MLILDLLWIGEYTDYSMDFTSANGDSQEEYQK
jgi:hypothetical protein